MHSFVSRRRFLARSCPLGLTFAGLALPWLGSVHGIAPLQRSGSARLALSLAAYSFRDFFKDSRDRRDGSPDASKQIDLFQFIDYCADHGCQGTELTSYYFPANVTDEFLLKLKHHAFLRGIAISGTAVGNTFTVPPSDKRTQEIAAVKKWIDRAQILGAPHIRVFAGTAQGVTKPDARQLAIEALQECCEYAGRKGVMLGLENHGGIVAEPDDLLAITQAIENPWFGVNLDTGNFHTDDPYADLARCAPYAVNVQVKSEIQRRGRPKEKADLGRLVRILREAKYQGFVTLEYEAAEDPWQAVPGILAELRSLCE